jgi:hypothetical protein
MDHYIKKELITEATYRLKKLLKNSKSLKGDINDDRKASSSTMQPNRKEASENVEYF